MVWATKTAYHIKQLQSANTKTIWKTFCHHNTHHLPILPLEGQTDFKAKYVSLRNTLFPAVNNLPHQHLPPNFLNSKLNMYQKTHPITTLEVSLAITHLKYDTSVGRDGITYTILRHLHKSTPRTLLLLFDACLVYSVHPTE